MTVILIMSNKFSKKKLYCIAPILKIFYYYFCIMFQNNISYNYKTSLLFFSSSINIVCMIFFIFNLTKIKVEINYIDQLTYLFISIVFIFFFFFVSDSD